MARIELGYVRADASFVERLHADLNRHALDVTLREWSAAGAGAATTEDPDTDFTCLVLSCASAAHERTATEITRAMERENGPLGVVVLPLLIDVVALPEQLVGRRFATFNAGYETGLAELLPTFGRIAVITRPVPPVLDVNVLSARRGIAKRFGSFTRKDGVTPVSAIDTHRIWMVTAHTLRGAGVMAMVESVGDPEHTPEFSECVGTYVLEAFTSNELRPTNESFSRLFKRVDAAAREMSAERQLRRSRRLSCRLAVALRCGDSVYWDAVGPMGLLMHCHGDDDTTGVAVCSSRGTFTASPQADDNEALYCIAPLGYVTELELEVQRVPFRVPGDYLAMASFALPRRKAEQWALVSKLLHYQDPAQVARALAVSHEPPSGDCAVSVMFRVDPGKEG